MRPERLRRGREFDTAYRQGTSQGGPLLVVRHRQNLIETTRWGFAVGKKLEKRAVYRNRLRRKLREAARSLPVMNGYDVIVTARPAAFSATYQDLRKALEASLRRTGLLETP